MPEDPNSIEWLAEGRRARPDFVFSFYYRHMLSAAWLNLPKRGALNMHGSLLPKYRGRAPVHWAIIRGETVTGASLHYMLEKPDAGALVDQQPVPIGENDTALEVSQRVAEAAQTVLHAEPAEADRGQCRGAAVGSFAGLVFRAPPSGGRAHRLAGRRARHPRSGARGRAAVSGRVHRSERATARGMGNAHRCRRRSGTPGGRLACTRRRGAGTSIARTGERLEIVKLAIGGRSGRAGRGARGAFGPARGIELILKESS